MRECLITKQGGGKRIDEVRANDEAGQGAGGHAVSGTIDPWSARARLETANQGERRVHGHLRGPHSQGRKGALPSHRFSLNQYVSSALSSVFVEPACTSSMTCGRLKQ